MSSETIRTKEVSRDARPVYEAPRVTLLGQKQILEVFQITSAGVSWWG